MRSVSVSQMSAVLLLLLVMVVTVRGRVYDRCELAWELLQRGVPRQDVATWVCIARHESEFNTSAVGHMDGASGDHGIFQISDRYWCSPPGVGTACGLTCGLLEDEDLGDDVACALRIHRDHGRRDGNGFTAWTVYRRLCRGDVSGYVRGCDLNTTTTTTPTETFPSPTAAARRKLKNTNALKKYKTQGKYVPDSSLSVLRDDGSTSGLSRSSGTGLQRPASAPASTDPRRAWFSLHYDPRFLDEYS